MHDGALVLNGCMKSLRVLGWWRLFCWERFSPWSMSLSIGFSSIFYKELGHGLLTSLPLCDFDQIFIQKRKEE